MNRTAKSVARSAFRTALLWSGKSGVSRKMGRSRWRRRRVLVLCYHGVSIQDEHKWLDQLFVTPAFLRRRLEIIRDSGCHVLPLGESVRRLKEGSLPERSVVLTFDDGFYNYVAAALPLLEEFGYAATNYVSTYYVQNQRPLINLAISYLIWKSGRQLLEPNTIEGQLEAVDLTQPNQRDALNNLLMNRSLTLSHDKRQQTAWLAEVAGVLDVDWEEISHSRILHLMNMEELAHAVSKGTDLQLHTHRHRTPDQRDLFVGEINRNREIIESVSGRTASHFCYPSGRVMPDFVDWLADIGIESATTGFTSLAREDDNPLLLPRFIDTMHQSEDIFESWLHGIPDFVRPRRAIQ